MPYFDRNRAGKQVGQTYPLRTSRRSRIANQVNTIWVGAAEPFSATGGTITDVGKYRYHVFTATGNFTPNQSGTVEAFLVAGGGGGANGGGGAGGVLTFSSVAVSAGATQVTVGARGADSNTNGGDSSFRTLTAVGGGRGTSGGAGAAGGSGGGGRSGGNGGGAGTAGQGNNGGCGDSSGGAFRCAGGGGWGSAGLQTGCTGYGRGDGGSGYALSNVSDFASLSAFSGMSTVGSGGGGQGDGMYGGTNGIGGTGAGSGRYITQDSSQNATMYGCGGGGTGSVTGSFGLGFDGIVVIRYPKP